jgi:Tfp pilus assembly protein FimV
MSIFSTILEKLGIHKPAAPAAPATAKPTTPVAPGASAKLDQMAQSHPGPVLTPQRPVSAPVPAPIPAKSAEIPMVDVVSKLNGLAKASPIELDWKVSINDLMVLLGMDHSAEAIKELAVELGCPESELGDSYKRNVWTHKALLKKIAENGGNIPQNLLH